MEQNLGTCIPDILIYDAGRPYIAIEIVVTHEPEESVITYFKENNITLVVFKLVSDEDLELVNNEVLEPSIVDLCSNPKCKICGKSMNTKTINIVTIKCWKCNRPMKVAWTETEMVVSGPESFTATELEYANNKGVNIKKISSKTMDGKQYLANVCGYCGAFIGQFFIGNYLGEEELSEKCGYVCIYCELNDDE